MPYLEVLCLHHVVPDPSQVRATRQDSLHSLTRASSGHTVGVISLLVNKCDLPVLNE